MGDVTEVLREGDAVFLDYVVGLNGTREEVCCDLVWHGRRPRGAWQMSPEEFGQRLQIDTQDAVNSLCFEDVETEIERAEVASRVVPPGCPQTLGCRTTRSPAGAVERAARSLRPVFSVLYHRRRCFFGWPSWPRRLSRRSIGYASSSTTPVSRPWMTGHPPPPGPTVFVFPPLSASAPRPSRQGVSSRRISSTEALFCRTT